VCELLLFSICTKEITKTYTRIAFGLNLNFAESNASIFADKKKTRQTTSGLKTGRQDILMANNGAINQYYKRIKAYKLYMYILYI